MNFLRTKLYIFSQWSQKNMRRIGLSAATATMVTVIMFLSSMVVAPKNFPTGKVVTIPEGATLSDIAELFDDKSIVASPFFFTLGMKVFGNETLIKAGDYFFDEPNTVVGIVKKLSNGDRGLNPVKVTIPEGSTVLDIAALFAEKYSEFNASRFLELAEGKEGYLFPDTYFFLQNVKEDEVLKEMEKTFDARIASIQDEIDASGRSFSDIVIMASIIEKEAWKEKDRRLISGVLWNRIDINMPLQVDAAFLYINGKNTYELTKSDLGTDSPYNTYKYRGLPPGPICSPSLSSLRAAASPRESSYLFYLADRKGNTYYSLDYEQHKRYKKIHIN